MPTLSRRRFSTPEVPEKRRPRAGCLVRAGDERVDEVDAFKWLFPKHAGEGGQGAENFATKVGAFRCR